MPLKLNDMSRKRTHKVFLEEVEKRHGKNKEWKFLSEYESYKKHVFIQTKYGVCKVLPESLLTGKGVVNIRSAIDKTEYSINMSIEVHKNKYDYSLYKYNTARTKSTIICKEHGKFEQSPDNHTHGFGCPKCGVKNQKKREIVSTEHFIQRSKRSHKNKYDYSLVDYKGVKAPVTIICKKHGKFEQVAGSHANGHGCPKCAATSNFHMNSPGKKCVLYVIECYKDDEKFIKIGITSNSVSKRFANKRGMPYAFTILRELKSYDSEAIFYLENLCLSMTSICAYTPKIAFSGYSECRDISVKSTLLNYLDNIGSVEDCKTFSLQMAGKDLEFDKKYKKSTGLSVKEGLKAFDRHLKEFLNPTNSVTKEGSVVTDNFAEEYFEPVVFTKVEGFSL